MTEKSETLAVLDIQDPKHPRLELSSTAEGEDAPETFGSTSTEVESHEESEAGRAASTNGEQQSSNATATDNNLPASGNEIENVTVNGAGHVQLDPRQLETALAEAENHGESRVRSMVAAPNDEMLLEEGSQTNAIIATSQASGTDEQA